MRRAVLLAALAAAVAVPVAHADGDPASDYLLTYQVFYPYYASVPKASLAQLESTVADANKHGYKIRVAVITSPYDLGSVSSLWEKPQPYARFLSLEISFAYRGGLLIVSPKGYGYVAATNKPDPARLALVRSVPIGTGTNGLLLTADKAVRLLATKAGVRLPATAAASSSGSGSGMDTVVIAVVAAVGALIVVGIEFARRGRKRRRPASAHR
jgi:hypothetical protein